MTSITEQQQWAADRAVELVTRFRSIIAPGKKALQLAAHTDGFTILIHLRDGSAVTARSADLEAAFAGIEQALEDYQASPLGKVN